MGAPIVHPLSYLSEMMRPCSSSSFKFTPKHEENKRFVYNLKLFFSSQKSSEREVKIEKMEVLNLTWNLQN